MPSAALTPQSLSIRQMMHEAALMPDLLAQERLLAMIDWPDDAVAAVQAEARRLVEALRRGEPRGLDAFLKEYSLSCEEGIVLMCIAEALLRIPDDATRDRLIRDKLGSADWAQHLGKSGSLLVNASTWALMLAGRMMTPDAGTLGNLGSFWQKLVARSGEPVVRRAVVQAMRILGKQFVMGETIGEATERAEEGRARGYRHSFDMLGEAARTAQVAERYFEAYQAALRHIGCVARGRGPIDGPGLSVKLSALHPRYELAQRDRVMRELLPRLLVLCEAAAERDIALCIDAEEADRLELSLDVIGAALANLPRGWEGFGLAVQAYQKRAPLVVDWMAEQARSHHRRIQIRLVKGAYWDSEIKRAQERGLAGYPVHNRKVVTDLSYLVCAQKMAALGACLFPQFATHNAYTVAAIRRIFAGRQDFEFQRLHGMGAALYDPLLAEGLQCRVYAPVGSHEDLLPYLVRRLLENGANSSFVNRLADATAPIEVLTADPVQRLREAPKAGGLPLPAEIFLPERVNSAGFDFGDPQVLDDLGAAMTAAFAEDWQSAPVIAGRTDGGTARPAHNPADLHQTIGQVREAGEAEIERALALTARAAPEWDAVPVEGRAAILERAARLFEENGPRLMAICVREAGKTIPDALAELRETVDYLRYYAARARADFGGMGMPGPTGESNCLSMHGRGLFACISPWNFPLAIFTGQVAAALAAGNAVVAKPAEQTPLVAAEAVRLLLAAGVPAEVLALLPGDGDVGRRLVEDRRVDGVSFTGSVDTAVAIQRSLAGRGAPIVPLIAETGGLNAMIVDSSALPEQVVQDALLSAFSSAGQRCSALRLMFVQDSVAGGIIGMLKGAMDELRIGDPAEFSTDIGPLIDRTAQDALLLHAHQLEKAGKSLHACPLPGALAGGAFFAPRLVELEDPALLDREVFGPFLHVVRFAPGDLDRVLDWIAKSGYGLTLGVHSRIETTVSHVLRHAKVGNLYVNRSMIGAVVGSQPFGGEGLSGTGPKAGGPRTLHRYATERHVSVNTVASGGNPALLSYDDGS